MATTVRGSLHTSSAKASGARQQVVAKTAPAHQAISFMLAEMATKIEASRLLTWQASLKLDRQQRASKEASMAKLFASETAVKVTQDAVQIYGGYGYNSEYPVEKLYRDAKIFQIYEGTSQIQKLIISRQLI